MHQNFRHKYFRQNFRQKMTEIDYMSRNALVPIEDSLATNTKVTESDLLIFECKLATLSEPQDAPVVQSRHASESLFHTNVVDFAHDGLDRYKIPIDKQFWNSSVSSQHEHLFVKSQIMASASFDANELYVEFDDFHNLDFWLQIVVDLETMTILKIDKNSRHQPGYAVIFGERMNLCPQTQLFGERMNLSPPMQYPIRKFYGYMSNNFLHVYDEAAGAEAFKIVCDLSKFIEFFNKSNNKKRKDDANGDADEEQQIKKQKNTK